jgi:hypothetical protein
MKKLSKKGALLFATAMAFCAFAMPSMASAASWSPVGLETTLHSSDFGFTSSNPALGRIQSNCTRSSLTARVTSASLLDVTAATFGGHCTAQFLDIAGAPVCTDTATPTNFPWPVTPAPGGGVVHETIDIFLENTPGNANCTTAGLSGGSFRITGSPRGSYTNATRSLVFSNSEGLVMHSAATGTNNIPVTTRATFISTGNLQLLP